ncbi:MAG: hypothetical protein R3F55_00650 [Alphaproteobacteria bacterium]
MAACAAAVQAQPGTARFAFQYARALHRAGQAPAAARLYEWAAGDGFAPAQYALGIMLQTGDGVPADPAAARRWLDAAAAQGYAADPVVASGPPAAATPVAAVADPSPTDLPDGLEALADALDGVRRDASRDRFDLDAVPLPAGAPVEAVTAWVADQTALVPYRGSLRGARGTLIDRTGNSLDRALLLAALLSAAGYEVRLARTTLDAATAAALLDAYAAPPDEPAPALSAEALAQRLTAAAGGAVPDLPAALARAAADDRAVADAVQRRSDAMSRDLLARLGDVAVGTAAADRAAAIAALQDHWWVQVRRTGGLLPGWTDADPSAGTVGHVDAAETLSPTDLPTALQHAVVLRVVVAFWVDGGLREETVLEHRLVPADLLDRPVVLRQLPVSALPAFRATPGADATETALAAATEAWVWQPELSIGGEVFADRLFTTAGTVLPANADSLRELGLGPTLFGDTNAVSQDAVSMLSDEPVAAEPVAPDEANAPVRVAAEWLAIEIDVPGAAPVLQRRTVFDLLGPVARSASPVPAPTLDRAERQRRALALLREVDIQIAGASTLADFVRGVLARDMAALLRALAPALRDGAEPTAEPTVGLPRIPLPLYRYAALRFAGTAARPYLDRPNVSLLWTGLDGERADALQPWQQYDIVANDVGVVAADGFAARLAQGVRDSVTEDELAGTGVPGSTASLYEAGLAAGRPWLLLDPADPGAVGGLALPDAARAAIAADLAGGAYVVAPPSPVETDAGPKVAWWRIDARSGTTLGMTPHGGADMVENAFLVAQGVQTGLCFMMLGRAIAGNDAGGAAAGMACAAGGVGGAVAGGIGGGVIAMVTAMLATGILIGTG